MINSISAELAGTSEAVTFCALFTTPADDEDGVDEVAVLEIIVRLLLPEFKSSFWPVFEALGFKGMIVVVIPAAAAAATARPGIEDKSCVEDNKSWLVLFRV